MQVALLVKQALDAFGLVGFPKTSSAEGMHILVPVERRYTYEDTRQFAEIVAGAIARTHRGLATTEWTKAKRRGVLIDANQNGEGKTIASVYSVRPRAGRARVDAAALGGGERGARPARRSRCRSCSSAIRKHGDLYRGRAHDAAAADGRAEGPRRLTAARPRRERLAPAAPARARERARARRRSVRRTRCRFPLAAGRAQPRGPRQRGRRVTRPARRRRRRR